MSLRQPVIEKGTCYGYCHASVAEKRPGQCPTCGRRVLQGWGSVSKPVIDPQVVLVHRYRCTSCHKTFRQYPPGVSSADQTDRMRFLCALIWKIGASIRQTTGLLGIWKPTVCHMTVWRDLQWAAQRRPSKQKVRVAGLDGFYTKIKGKDKGLMVLLDMGDGQPVELAEDAEENPEKLRNGCCPWQSNMAWK